MRQKNFDRELTVYISNNEREFRLVEQALAAEAVNYRVWTTSEYPVLGWTRLDPRLMIRGEKRLRQVYHIEVPELDRQNLVAANIAIRRVTGHLSNAEPISEII